MLRNVTSLAHRVSRRCVVRSATAISPCGFEKRAFNRSYADGVLGAFKTNGFDVESAFIGQELHSIDECTFGEGWREIYQSSMYEPDRLYSSTSFALKLGFQSHLLPFSFLLNHVVGMSHIDETKVVLDLGFDNAVHLKEAYSGQTFRKNFTIKRLRLTQNGKNTIVTIKCDLINQDTHDNVFTVDKIMLFKGVTNPTRSSTEPLVPRQHKSELFDAIVHHAASLPTAPTLAHLEPKQLMLHAIARPIGRSTSMSLASLFRMTHPTIFNMHKYGKTGLVVPGALVLSAAMSAASRDLFEVLYQQLTHCSFQNKVCPTDTIGAMSYVHSISAIGNGLEEVDITTVGVKNFDVMTELEGKTLPLQLFEEQFAPHDCEEMLEDKFPSLVGNVVVIARRKLVRQSHYAVDHHIPLL